MGIPAEVKSEEIGMQGCDGLGATGRSGHTPHYLALTCV